MRLLEKRLMILTVEVANRKSEIKQKREREREREREGRKIECKFKQLHLGWRWMLRSGQAGRNHAY